LKKNQVFFKNPVRASNFVVPPLLMKVRPERLAEFIGEIQQGNLISFTRHNPKKMKEKEC
jgi:hypothetical protein